jgi:hypothetical protein
MLSGSATGDLSGPAGDSCATRAAAALRRYNFSRPVPFYFVVVTDFRIYDEEIEYGVSNRQEGGNYKQRPVFVKRSGIGNCD